MANTDSSGYYQKVADYYDHEACSYEERYWRNIVAQRIRQSFREEVKTHSFTCVLEIGCGTGLDASHFGSIYPDRQVYGIDIAPAMVESAVKKIQDQGLANVSVRVGAPEDLNTLFPEVEFDHIYVFFGALNTVPDLPAVARILKQRMKRNGTMVLTFVNKWYLADMVIDLLRFRFKRAFRRMQEIWGGYSEAHQIESRCFSPHEIREAFGNDFQITRTKGYSILYPAWYRSIGPSDWAGGSVISCGTRIGFSVTRLPGAWGNMRSIPLKSGTDHDWALAHGTLREWIDMRKHEKEWD